MKDLSYKVATKARTCILLFLCKSTIYASIFNSSFLSRCNNLLRRNDFRLSPPILDPTKKLLSQLFALGHFSSLSAQPIYTLQTKYHWANTRKGLSRYVPVQFSLYLSIDRRRFELLIKTCGGIPRICIPVMALTGDHKKGKTQLGFWLFIWNMIPLRWFEQNSFKHRATIYLRHLQGNIILTSTFQLFDQT